MRVFKASVLLVGMAVAGGLLYRVATGPKDREAIIGVWQQPENNAEHVLEFRRDGTFLDHNAFGTHAWTYSWAGERRIQIQYERDGTNGTTVSEKKLFGVSSGRNVLLLTNFEEGARSEPTRYRRLKHGDLRKLALDDFRGRQLVRLPATATPEQVISALFEQAASKETKVGRYKIEQLLSVWSTAGMSLFAWVDTDRGRRGVDFVFDRPQIGVGSLRGWWCEVTAYDPAGEPAQSRASGALGESRAAQPDGAADGSQPFSSDTNRASGAAGSRR